MWFSRPALPGVDDQNWPISLTGVYRRSDQSGFLVIGLARPTGLTGQGRLRVQLMIFIDLDLVIGFLAGQVHSTL